YVTETKRFRSVSDLFSDSEDEPADPNIIYEEPRKPSPQRKMSPTRLSRQEQLVLLKDKREMLSIRQKQIPPPHAPTVRLPKNRKEGPGARANWVGEHYDLQLKWSLMKSLLVLFLLCAL
ncbi:hypothetical protein RJ639_023572, partial [Escallonia herrerae]